MSWGLNQDAQSMAVSMLRQGTGMCRRVHGDGGGGCSRQPGLCDGLHLSDACQVVHPEPARCYTSLDAMLMQPESMTAAIIQKAPSRTAFPLAQLELLDQSTQAAEIPSRCRPHTHDARSAACFGGRCTGAAVQYTQSCDWRWWQRCDHCRAGDHQGTGSRCSGCRVQGGRLGCV